MKFRKIILLILFILFSSVSCSFFQDEENDKKYVFIVGSYYHKRSCISILGTTGTPITKENAEKKGYIPCSTCNP